MVYVYSNDSGVVIAYTLKLTRMATANLSSAITDAIVAKAGNVSIGNYSVNVSSVSAAGTLSVCVELSLPFITTYWISCIHPVLLCYTFCDKFYKINKKDKFSLLNVRI